MPVDPSEMGTNLADHVKQLRRGPGTVGPKAATLNPDVGDALKERRRRQLRSVVASGAVAAPMLGGE
tara:strand:+ start:648 stop:848 length:201 start_codon:yes stop_codon:yes gene_type:complete